MNAQLREAAATLCSAMATDRISPPWRNCHDIADALGTPIEAHKVAWDALILHASMPWHVAWAEACSLLRSGEFQGCR